MFMCLPMYVGESRLTLIQGYQQYMVIFLEVTAWQ